MQLALFDLDDTLLDGDSDDLWCRFLVDQGVLDQTHYVATRKRFSEDYREGRLQVLDFYTFVLQPLAENPLQKLQDWRLRFMRERIVPRITHAARALLNQHRKAGHVLVIVTATNRFVSEPIATELGVPFLLATEPETDGSCFTGRVAGVPCFREGKLLNLQTWMQRHNFQPEESWFYTDSHNDLALLEYVDHPVAVNPDLHLAKTACARDWPVISLRAEQSALAL